MTTQLQDLVGRLEMVATRLENLVRGTNSDKQKELPMTLNNSTKVWKKSENSEKKRHMFDISKSRTGTNPFTF